jgi:hypothetical protein
MSLPQRIYSQVPEFVRSDHPAFLEFLKAYSAWLTTEYSPNKIEDLVDIDDTVNEFIQYFKKELDINGVLQGVDNRTYLRHIKELYASKGSTAGLEFLFKILYGEKSSVQHPWDYVFKPSNGEWFQDISVLATPTTGDLNGMLGNPVIITDDAGVKYQTVVTNINTRRNGVVELFIGRFTHEAPLYSIESLTGDISAVLLQTTVQGKVERRGSGFRIGQVFKVNSYGGSGSLVKVKAVDSNGGITAVEIIGFGTGYNADFNLLISPTNFIDPTTLGARVNFNLTQYYLYPTPTEEDPTPEPILLVPPRVTDTVYKTNDVADIQNESGSIVKHLYTDLDTTYMTDPSYVGETVGTFQSQRNTQYVAGDYASIKFTVGHICIYPGYYKSSNNIIGDLVYIEDSYYYQAFSYVTVLEKKLEDYSDLLRRTLHPAGTKHFGTYLIFDNLQLNATLDPSLNLISKADAIRDVVQLVEELIFNLEVAYSDSAVVTELFDRVLTAQRSFEDATTNVDDTQYSFDIYPVYSDTATVTEVFDRVFDSSRSFGDTATVTEVFDRVFDSSRSFGDTATVTEVFSRVWSANPSLDDSLTTTEDFSRVWTANTALTDTASITEIIEIVPGIILPDSIATTTLDPVFEASKYSNDTVTAISSGGLYMEPYYVEVSPDTYWQAGYLENEREFTN